MGLWGKFKPQPRNRPEEEFGQKIEAWTLLNEGIEKHPGLGDDLAAFVDTTGANASQQLAFSTGWMKGGLAEMHYHREVPT